MGKKMATLHGYKGFKFTDGRLKCRDTIYEIGVTMKHTDNVEPCASGYHYCRKFKDVLT